ncbi:MAG: glycosyltransferase family 4 protein [Gammaproteobacteria bacterium]|nr:glycosyltransferase family 4 protein [Gammaproteobacteria bacterium]
MSVRPWRLLIVATHPVQYLSPWLQELADRPEFDLTVWYVILPDTTQQGVGFDQAFSWDVPLLEGYTWRCVDNHATKPGLDGFFGSRVRGHGRMLSELAPDAVLVTGWHQWSLMQIAIGCRIKGIPLLVRGDSNDLGARPPWKRRLQRILLRLYDGYLYTGSANRGFYLARGVDECRLFPCPHFVDNSRFALQDPDRSEAAISLRQDWGVAAGDTVFLFVGKLQQKKHPDHLLNAFRMVREKNPATHLVLVGDGELRDSLQHAASKSGSSVTFAGFVNQAEIARYYTAADVLVLPSDSGETWGLVVNEAMASGMGVIVSDQVGCHPDLVIEGNTGFCYPFGNLSQLVDRMLLSCDSTSRMVMVDNGQKRIRQYSSEVASEGLLRALDFIVKTGADRF